jgi:tRNA (guanine37-N1)-methyltransferase
MISLKVPLRHAEKAKRFLLEKQIYDKNHRPKKTEEHIYFPVLKKEPVNIPGAAYENIELEPAKKNEVSDHLDFTEEEKRHMPASYDVIGDIIIIDIPGELSGKEKEVGEALLKTQKNIKTVLKKSGQHEGEFRTQPLEHVAGENRKETIHKENNARIKLDVEKIYFSPRLSTERKRIYEQVKKGEKILVMFSGSGPYPIVLSKNTEASKILGIEKNPVAHKYALDNIRINKVKNVELIQGDVREIVPKLNETFDRILMPLPKGAMDFLDLVKNVSKKGTVVHFYDFEHEIEMEKAEEKVKKILPESKILRTVKCGQYSPGKFRVCVDFIV